MWVRNSTPGADDNASGVAALLACRLDRRQNVGDGRNLFCRIQTEKKTE